ncbi:MAG: hypothetical protein H8M99_01395 [Gloeobacteraceae cyanobacterium ES-bin-144]|nr:hypothetical protein [Verrucomicrobiales bacterium]
MVLNKVFDNVLDIPGVDGVCLFGMNGQVYLNRMPSFLAPEVFSDALRRITALYETMDENFLPCDDYLLRFAEKWILFRRTDQAVLLVLAAETANFASTRMVTNMALKHLTPSALAELDASTAVPVVAPAATAPVARLGSSPTATPFSNSPFQASPSPVVPPPVPVAAPAPAEAPVANKTVRMFRGRPY